ncbi:MAG: hypothetical protein EA402_12460 [Planctomycetota bacterium]|nr:MAG: hypothetical protein EA402_12460 [Planctomycetota bacterium]
MSAPWTTKLAGLGLLGGRTLLLLLVLVLVSASAKRLDLRLDWSANRHFTIDAELAAIIENLDQPIRLIGVWPEHPSNQEGERLATIGRLVAPALEAMARRSTFLRWTHVDNELDLPLLEELRQRHDGIHGPALYLIPDNEAGHRPFRIPLSGILPLLLQREVGGALLTLSGGEPPMVLVLQGHGELRPSASGEDGLRALMRSLELSGFRPALFDQQSLSDFGRLPAHAVLFIAGPTSPIGAPMLAAIEQHLRDGGPVMLMADHRISPELSDLLAQRGILIGPRHPLTDGFPIPSGLLSDQRHPAHLIYSEPFSTGRDGSYHRLVLRPEVALVEDFFRINQNSHTSGRLLRSPTSVPVAVADPRFAGDDGERVSAWLRQRGLPPLRAEPLLILPSAQSWVGPLASRQDPPNLENRQGSIPLAWAITYEPDERSALAGQGARLVVWGSRQAASDTVIAGDAYANAQLISDSLGWLSDRGSRVSIPAASFTPFRVEAEEGTIAILLAILVALIPCCFLGGAMLAYWERRS